MTVVGLTMPCEDFLAEHGWGAADVVPLVADASSRRYYRLRPSVGEAVLLMDAPPPQEKPSEWMAVGSWLASVGLSTPSVLASDLRRGVLLIEDFGTDRMREALDAAPGRETELYGRAVDVLLHLRTKTPVCDLPTRSFSQFIEDVIPFVDWYCPNVGLTLDKAAKEAFTSAWRVVLAPVFCDHAPRVTTLRDYHSENIMLLSGRDGVRSMGLLDFQDAFIGHPAYDLASLLEDARRDVPEGIERAMVDYYCRSVGGDAAAFEHAYWVLAAARNVRILGTFVRLWKRDGKPKYTALLPRMWRLVERDLAQPALASVREWFDEHVPCEARGALWVGVKTELESLAA